MWCDQGRTNHAFCYIENRERVVGCKRLHFFSVYTKHRSDTFNVKMENEQKKKSFAFSNFSLYQSITFLFCDR